MHFMKTKESSVAISNNSYSIQDGKTATMLFIHENGEAQKTIKIGKGASVKIFSVYGGGATIANSFELSENSTLEIHDIFSGNAKVDNKIPIEERNCTLNLMAKGTVKENESSSYFANAKIGKNASNANVNLEEHAYLLAKGAKATLLPGLEIINSEVNARHASSISEIDAEQIFYLMSRGFPEQEARKEIVSGFIAHEAEKIKQLFNYSVKI